MKENHKHRTGLYRCILFFMLAMFVTAGVSSAMLKVQVLCERNQTFCYGIDFWSDQKGKPEI